MLFSNSGLLGLALTGGVHSRSAGKSEGSKLSHARMHPKFVRSQASNGMSVKHQKTNPELSVQCFVYGKLEGLYHYCIATSLRADRMRHNPLNSVHAI